MTSTKDKVLLIAASNLTIYDPLTPESPLWLTAPELEQLTPLYIAINTAA